MGDAIAVLILVVLAVLFEGFVVWAGGSLVGATIGFGQAVVIGILGLVARRVIDEVIS